MRNGPAVVMMTQEVRPRLGRWDPLRHSSNQPERKVWKQVWNELPAVKNPRPVRGTLYTYAQIEVSMFPSGIRMFLHSLGNTTRGRMTCRA